MNSARVRVVLPYHLRNLAGIESEVILEINPPLTLGAVFETLEDIHPKLRGTFRDRHTGLRRAFVRYFACQEDISHAPHDQLLPPAIGDGLEPLFIVGAMAGG